MDYSPEVARRFGSPVRTGRPAPRRGAIAVGEAEDRTLNVWVRFFLDSDGASVVAVRYEIFGCPHAVAAASAAADWLEGRPIETIGSLDMHAIAESLDVPTAKLGKLLRIEDAVQQCADELEALRKAG